MIKIDVDNINDDLVYDAFGVEGNESYYGQTYHSFEEMKHAIRRYIECYNKYRIKVNLGWLSPENYRLRYASE